MKPPTKPGLYPGLSMGEYLQIDAISSTGLRKARVPREYWHWQRHATVQTDAMRAGSLAHIQVLDPQAWLTRVVLWDELVREKDGSPKVYPNGETKLAPRNPNSKAYKAFLAANPGREVVTQADLDAARRIEMALRDNPEARDVLSRRWEQEYTVVWHHSSGALCKGRIDWLTNPRGGRTVELGDLKRARTIDEKSFAIAAARYEYHAQLAWYGDGLRAHFPGIDIMYMLLAVETGGSHDSTVFDVSTAEIDAGRELNEARLDSVLWHQEHYGDRPWPGRCHRTFLNFAEHCPWVLGDDDGRMGGIDLSGVERVNGTED
jgi:hypothetical protein